MISRMESPVMVEVVTAFLENDNRILILRRSTKVRTMKGKWGAVSGYLEDNDPLRQAVVEIKEETGLNNSDIQFIRSGHIVEATDPDGSDIRYIVHPYLFHSKGIEIILSSEHDQCKWIALNEMSKYDTVPKLKEACESVIVAHNTLNDEENFKS
jgi:8-oxo-dGTP diphosphatase